MQLDETKSNTLELLKTNKQKETEPKRKYVKQRPTWEYIETLNQKKMNKEEDKVK